MNKLVKGMQAFWQDEEGVTAIEYGLIAALIAVLLVGILTNTGTALQGTFQKVCTALTGAACALT
ncbi:Flp family type IVb pilin [Crenobacter intestini]|uniref:Flp family type IVb pilin n=1 Tax=Crenobacter intestini TaxID=2563443 RepID=A0A4T0V276_9NEIS|nr:Flp family type IVb pilin [Crenobacter intestini]TIC85255.1 Flp family type IVb pilin [Crenobacter intestini]